MLEDLKKCRREQNHKTFPTVFSDLFQTTVISIEQHFAATLCFFSSSLIVWHIHTLMGFLPLGVFPSRRVMQLKGKMLSASEGWRCRHESHFPPDPGTCNHCCQESPGRKGWKYPGGVATDHKPSPASKADLPYKQLYITQVINQ